MTHWAFCQSSMALNTHTHTHIVDPSPDEAMFCIRLHLFSILFNVHIHVGIEEKHDSKATAVIFTSTILFLESNDMDSFITEIKTN